MRFSSIARAVRSVLFVSAALAARQAVAAEAAPDSGALEEVVVTGYALSLEQAIANKREAAIVSDGISAEDIGKFPEQNVADALQRVTGVQVVRNLGDGQFISVRGLDPKFTNVLYNGRQLTTGSGTRAFDFQLLPAGFANRVDAYKSSSADVREGGLAATINMQTLKPLDYGKQQLVLTAQGAYDEQARGEVKPQFSGLYTDTFLEGRLGWLVAAGVGNRRMDVQSAQSDGVTLATSPYNGVPTTNYRVFGLRVQDLVGSNDVASGMTMLQFKLNDAVELRADGLLSHFKQVYDFYPGSNYYVGAGTLGASPTASMTVDDQNITRAWSGSNVFSYASGNHYAYDQKLTAGALGATLDVGDWHADAEASVSRARRETTNIYVNYSTAAGRAANVSYDSTVDPDGPLSITTYGGYNSLDPTNYAFGGMLGSYEYPTTDELWNVKADITRNLQAGWLEALKFGVDYSDRTLADSPNWIASTKQGLPANMAAYLTVRSNPSFFDSYHGPATVARSWLSPNLNGLFSDYPISQFATDHPPVPTLTSTTHVEEKAAGAYAKLDLESADRRWKGNVGVRAVRTQEFSGGYGPTPDAYLRYGLSFLDFSDAGIVTHSNSYTDVLPSLNMSYAMTDDLIVRFGAGRVMQRPDMNLLAAASKPTAAAQPPPSGIWRGTLAQGNPDLDPYRANQVDLSLEWYFNSRSLLSAAFFLKRVENLVLTERSTQVADVTLTAPQAGSGHVAGDVVPITFSVTQPVNAQSTTLKGVEVGLQFPLDFQFLPESLRAFGTQINYTHIWADDIVLNVGDAPLPVPGVSANTYNLGVYYSNRRIDVRALYNYRSGWVADPLSFFGDGLFMKGYGQTDVTASFNFTPALSVNAAVLNLENTAHIAIDKYGINRSYEFTARRFSLGVRLKF